MAQLVQGLLQLDAPLYVGPVLRGQAVPLSVPVHFSLFKLSLKPGDFLLLLLVDQLQLLVVVPQQCHFLPVVSLVLVAS